MSSQSEKIQRSILPIPDRQHVGLTTYDAKDPETKYPPIVPAGIVVGLVTGTTGTKYRVATREYNKKIDERIADIKRT